SLASTEYAKGVNEFVKSGLTPIDSDHVKPPRVKESPVSFECKVIEVKPLGNEGGAGNLVITEVLLMHVADEVLTDGKIDPQKIQLVGRMGGNWYSRAYGNEIFEVAKPLAKKGIGVDQIPAEIRNSEVLTGNDLGKLGNVEQLPTEEEVKAYSKEPEVKAILDRSANMEAALHQLAGEHLAKGDVSGAWKVLLQGS
ncbi:MAG: flavin reductase family protein, partial [Bacteroidota bacterium]